ncbi:MAG: GNAT family N-acetyltransferase [Lawsonibacter sp.]|nr:GNAT family N-acetyltransferase [Lawsonibacter sp.]
MSTKQNGKTERCTVGHTADAQDRQPLNIQYRDISLQELCPELFRCFVRHQAVTKCWRKEGGSWIIKDVPFTDDWTEADYQTLVRCLKNTLATGGFVHAAFLDGTLKGFVSVEPTLFGGEQQYLDLSSIHVSEELRGMGVGSVLFAAAKAWARARDAKKLYISAHSAAETQAFYRGLGCVEATVYNQQHVEAEPFDCQLEFELM